MKRIIFIGQNLFAIKTLLKLLKNPDKNPIEIVGIISTPCNGINSLKVIASLKNIPYIETNKKDEDINLWAKNLRPDIGIVMEYPKKILDEFIDIFNDYILNVHPSDLPKYRGGAPLEAHILNEKELIISIHKLTKKFDQGSILLKSNPINIEGLEIETIYKIIASLAPNLVLKAIDNICLNKSKFTSQDEKKASYYWAKDLNNILKLNFEDTCEQISKIILATYQKWGAIFELKNKNDIIKLKVFSCIPIEMETHEKPKTLLYADKDYLLITCKDGVIFINDYSDMLNNKKDLLDKKTISALKKIVINKINWFNFITKKEFI